MDFADWARAEIKRLRDEAAKAITEAETMEKSLARYEADKLKSARPASAPVPSMNGAAAKVGGQHIRRGRTQKGDKRAYAMGLLKTPGGVSMDDLYNAFVAKFGAGYKRSSLRAMIHHEKNNGNVAVVPGGKYAAVGAAKAEGAAH